MSIDTINILFLEVDAAHQSQLSKRLELHCWQGNWEIAVATANLPALLEISHFDVVIVDAGIPLASASTLVASVCQYRLPVLVKSTLSQEANALKILQSGAEDCILDSPRLFFERLHHKAQAVINHHCLSHCYEQAQKALTQRENLSLANFEQAAVGIAHLACDGQFIRLNQQFCKIVQHSHEELLTLTFQDITHPDDIAADLPYANCLLTGQQQTYTMEQRYIRQDGRVIWGHLTLSLVRNAEGTPQYFIAVVEDISDRKANEERLTLALQATNQGLYDLNLVTDEATVSPEYVLMLGYDPGDPYETITSWRNRIHPDDQEAVAAAYQAYVAGNSHQYRTEFRLQSKRGDWKWILSVGKFVEWDINSKPTRMLGTYTDITERKQAETALQNLIAGTAATTGQAFFPALVTRIATALGVSYAIVTEQIEGQLSTLGFWANGTLQPEYRYAIAKTPCERVLAEQEFYCDRSVQALFPEDPTLVQMGAEGYLGIALNDTQGNPIGNLCILDQQPLREPERARQILRVFAARAAAELERQRVTTSLEQLNQALETKVKERTRELTLTQTAVELAADAVFMIRRDSSFYYVNKAACQMLGHSREELLTLSVLDIDPNFTPETWPQHWQEAQQNYLLTIETQHQHQDGHLYPVEVNINYLELYGEELLFSCARDISDRKQAEVALRASEARLQLITDSVHGCIAYIDAEERYQFVNRTYEEWFDCQQNDLLGHTIESVIGTVAYQQIQQHVKHVLSGQTVTYEAEVPYQRGPTRYVSGFLVPDINPQGQVSGYYALITDISDRRRAELALQKSQHFIEQIANASPNILYLYDLQTSCNVYANRAIATTLGYSAEAVQAMGNDVLPALMHPDDFKQYAHHCERLKTAQDNEIFEFEYRMRHVNGQWLWLCSRDAVFNRDGQGQVQQIIGSAQDISDRKYTEETLRRSEATNRVLIEAIPDFLIRMRTDGTELEVVNARTVHCLYPGATPESIHGLSIIETMPTAIAQERIHLAKTALATGNMQRQEYSFLDQGQTYYEEARIMPLWKDEVLVVVRDITERKQAERIFHGQAAREKLLREVGQRIRESLDLQTIFETACQEIRTVLQADRVGIFRFYPSSSFNKGEFVAESVVAELGSVIGIPVKDHCFGENYASLYTQGKYLVADDILQNQLTPCHADILKKFAVRACMVFPLLCGEQLWGLLCVHQCTTVRHWHQSEIDFIQQLANQIAIAIQQANLYEQLQQELLERQQAQQQLTERNQQLAISNKNLASATRLKDEFLANMSHEIRTPMNAIIGMTHLTLETALTPKQQNYLAKIDKSAHALLRIINDILDFSKIEAGKLTLECVAFSLDEVLINLADSTHFKAINKELELVFEMGPNVPSHLCGDPLRLGQVLLNLVSNAIKFTRSGYVRVAISTLTQSDRTTTLKFTVQDTGIGLSPQQKEHLFQAFSQGDASTTRRYGGTGLGLAITKKLVTLMQGELGVHSIPDEGSTFWFTVPFKGAKFTRQPPVAADIAPLVGKRMLVIEENPATSSILMSLLQGLRLQAEVVDSGSAALTALAAANRSQHPYDSILMDYVMADMDGLSFMRHLHQDTHLAAIPTIMMVAPHQYRQAQQELQPLDVTLLRKPISALTLLEQLVPVFTGEHRCAATQLQVGSSSPDIVRSQQHSWQGLRILLVEDNALNQELTVAFLTRAQAMVTVANNGQEALEKLTANTYDAVLMDCQMPVMDGYEATRRIRSVLKQTALPIIAMTAHAMPRDRAKCLAVGMNDYLAKPINWADLANVLQRWIAPHISPTDQPLRSALVASAARQDIIDLAMLKHFDVEIGLDYVGHDDNLYRSLLHKFLAKQSNFITTIEKQLQAGDLTSAIRTTHTLKGISGTLGCKVLQARASTLEVELCGSTAPSITVALAQVRESLEAVMTELSRWAATQTRSTTLLPPTIQIPSLVNGPSLLTTIESTIHLLETDWVAAMEKVTLLKNTLQGRTDTRSLLVSIDSALDHFDTEQAKTGLEQLMQYVEAQL